MGAALAGAAHADDEDIAPIAQRADGQRPRVALVLSGGGAKGGAHLGVLKTLQRLRVPVDLVVGTSAGSIAGAAYASGMPLADIEAELRPLNTAVLLHDVDRRHLPMRLKGDEASNFIGPELGINPRHQLALPKGAVAGVSLEAVLRRFTSRQRVDAFDDLPLPFRAIATDLSTAEMVVLDHGSLSLAVRASMALPALVNPVDLDGRLLVDGGVSRNLPVDVARAMGADVVIAVNIGAPLHTREALTSLLSVSDQMVRILTARNVAQSLSELRETDVLISPDVGDISVTDFDRLMEAEAAGEIATLAQARRLAALAVDAPRYAAYEQRRVQGTALAGRIDAIEIDGLSRVSERSVRDSLGLRDGDVFDAATADDSIKRLYARGDFERVGYAFAEVPDGRRVLTVIMNEKSWGPQYLRFGLGLSSDFQGSANFDLRLDHRATWLNAWGAEWRNDLQVGHSDRVRTEWYQPLLTSQRLFVSASAQASAEPFDLYNDRERVARFRKESGDLRLELGGVVSDAGELRVGLRRGKTRLGNDTGPVAGRDLIPTTNTGGVEARVQADTLDSLKFPRQGYAADFRLYRSLPSLGAQDAYSKLDVSLRAARSWQAHSLRAAYFASHGIGGTEVPGYELAQLGGFLRLSGYRTGQFLGTEMRMARLVYSYRIASPGLLDGIHLGGSIEVGRVSDSRGLLSDGRTLRSNAAFLAVDTPIGPLYLAYGRASAKDSTVYLFLGVP
ncbi:patatin-like phospholipase family protein [Roseateles amylovorans]|uniref:Patatin-like phospholipase family protein n=1 Tax=Roseateles amylovorans TaxID=2978473 RepID=A0ABY6B0C1_9BURK|nr:patatin-like phospholipase family protein [Roseateles amylovorans]UXH78392.1 patatin-like phospholipase family protein [Roseateles amylovorans]